MNQTLKTLMIAGTIAIAGTAYVGTTHAAGMSAEEAIAAAKEARKHASSVGGEWRDTGKMIKKAEELLAQGKTEEAAKLAEEAEAQSMLGYMQATSQTLDNLHI